MSLIPSLRVWAQLPRSEKRRFLRACYWLCVCAGWIRIGGLPGLASYVERSGFVAGATPPADFEERISDWHRAVGRAARVLPVGTCLEKAATLQLLLGRDHINTSLRIGVRKDEQALQAHAWLERDGQPVLERVDPALREHVFTGPWTGCR